MKIILCSLLLCSQVWGRGKACVPIDEVNGRIAELNHLVASLMIENDLLRSGKINQWLVFNQPQEFNKRRDDGKLFR